MPAIIDTNVYLSRWPCRRLPDDEPERLARRLTGHGVVQAWAGSFDSLLHRDVAAVNSRLARDCREFGGGLFRPFGALNPALPGWQDDLCRCRDEHQMPGVRLHPNYHGYRLDAPEFARALELAAESRLVVQLALTMEDERTQHPLLRVPHVDIAPLADLVGGLPDLKLMVLNAFRAVQVEQLERLAAAGQVYFETAMLEGAGGLERLVARVTAERVLFGSYAPFFCFEAALFKLRESPLGGAQQAAILEENARRLVGPSC